MLVLVCCILLIYNLPDLIITNWSVNIRMLGAYPRVDHLVSALGNRLRVPRLVGTTPICVTHIRPVGGLLSTVDTQANAVIWHSTNWVESKHSLSGGTSTKAFCASSEEGLVAF